MLYNSERTKRLAALPAERTREAGLGCGQKVRHLLDRVSLQGLVDRDTRRIYAQSLCTFDRMASSHRTSPSEF